MLKQFIERLGKRIPQKRVDIIETREIKLPPQLRAGSVRPIQIIHVNKTRGTGRNGLVI